MALIDLNTDYGFVTRQSIKNVIVLSQVQNRLSSLIHIFLDNAGETTLVVLRIMSLDT